MQIAGTLPKTDGQLLAVDGVGKAKIAKYGPDVLRMVQEAE